MNPICYRYDLPYICMKDVCKEGKEAAVLDAIRNHKGSYIQMLDDLTVWIESMSLEQVVRCYKGVFDAIGGHFNDKEVRKAFFQALLKIACEKIQDGTLGGIRDIWTFVELIDEFTFFTEYPWGWVDLILDKTFLEKAQFPDIMGRIDVLSVLIYLSESAIENDQGPALKKERYCNIKEKLVLMVLKENQTLRVNYQILMDLLENRNNVRFDDAVFEKVLSLLGDVEAFEFDEIYSGLYEKCRLTLNQENRLVVFLLEKMLTHRITPYYFEEYIRMLDAVLAVEGFDPKLAKEFTHLKLSLEGIHRDQFFKTCRKIEELSNKYHFDLDQCLAEHSLIWIERICSYFFRLYRLKERNVPVNNLGLEQKERAIKCIRWMIKGNLEMLKNRPLSLEGFHIIQKAFDFLVQNKDPTLAIKAIPPIVTVINDVEKKNQIYRSDSGENYLRC